MSTVLQYLFFLRVPLLIGLLLITLPAIAVFVLPAMLRNLFVLHDSWQLTSVIISATIAGMAVSLVANTLLHNVPDRFLGLSSLPTIPKLWQYVPAFLLTQAERVATRFGLSLQEIELWQYILALVLGAFTWITATYLSFVEEELTLTQTLISLGSGVISSFIFLLAVELIRKWLKKVKEKTWLKNIFIKIISLLTIGDKQGTKGYIKNGDMARGHLSAIAFLFAALSIYLI